MYLHLRRRGTRRKAKAAAGEAGVGLIPGRTDIGLRLPVVDEKSRCGDLEVDLIIGKGHRGAVLTVVDRKSKHVWTTDGQDGGGDDAGTDPAAGADQALRVYDHRGQPQGVRGARRGGRGTGLGLLLRAAVPLVVAGMSEHTNGLARQY